MPNPDSEGIVSESDLAYLTDLFRRFEGATDPLSSDCKQAKEVFYYTLRTILRGESAVKIYGHRFLHVYEHDAPHLSSTAFKPVCTFPVALTDCHIATI